MQKKKEGEIEVEATGKKKEIGEKSGKDVMD